MITHPNVKINLGLNVLRRRPDGYHDLETLFVPYFGIQDTLEIIPADAYSETSASLFARYGSGFSGIAGASGHADRIFGSSAASDASGKDAADGVDWPRVVQAVTPDGKLMMTVARAEGVDWNPLKDLTVKAYQLLDADYDLPAVKIFLEKTSPVGAGLGGGSADAAFALRMFSELAGLGLSDEVLAGYAARIGSDCAFFIYNRPMIGEGRGEILTPFDLSFSGPDEALSGSPSDGIPGRTMPLVDFSGDCTGNGRYVLKVVVPEGISVSTADAYRGIVPALPQMPLREVLSRPIGEWKDLLVNDFEKTVFARYPELAAIKQSLYDSGAVYAAMSGSGSALFAVWE